MCWVAQICAKWNVTVVCLSKVTESKFLLEKLEICDIAVMIRTPRLYFCKHHLTTCTCSFETELSVSLANYSESNASHYLWFHHALKASPDAGLRSPCGVYWLQAAQLASLPGHFYQLSRKWIHLVCRCCNTFYPLLSASSPTRSWNKELSRLLWKIMQE